MSFIQYPSISNLTTKEISKISEIDLSKECVITEKIHGANFSFICNDLDIKCARRNAIINSTEKFHNWEKIFIKYCDKIKQIFNLVKNKYLSTKIIDYIIVYGEIYGGIYNHNDVAKISGAKHVQKEIFYCPDINFSAFDIYVCEKTDNSSEINSNLDNNNEKSSEINCDSNNNENSSEINCNSNNNNENSMIGFFLCYDETEKIFNEVNLQYCEPIKRGKFNELIHFDVEIFESTIHEKYNLPKIPNNIAEGIIIRSLYDRHIIFKKKSNKFSEIIAKKINYNTVAFTEDISNYINQNRLNSVLSKCPVLDLSNKTIINNIAFELVNDAIRDYELNSDTYKDLSNNSKKKLRKITYKLAIEIINQYINK